MSHHIGPQDLDKLRTPPTVTPQPGSLETERPAKASGARYLTRASPFFPITHQTFPNAFLGLHLQLGLQSSQAGRTQTHM